MSTIVLDTITGKSTSTNITIGSTPVVSASANSLTIRGEGSAQTSIQQGLCKCWAHISADGATVNDSLNVSSHDDDGTGDGGININNDMGSANYVIQLTVDHGDASSSVNSVEVTNGTQAAGAFDYTNNYVNSGENRVAFNVDRYIAVFGDLA